MQSPHRSPRLFSVAATAVALALVAGGAFALARGGSNGSSCGHGRSLPKRGDKYDLPRLGPLSFQAGFRGDFRLGVPYKVGITRYDMAQKTIELRGWRCADGRPLHFLYGNLQLPKPPLTARQLRRLGHRVERLPWYDAPEGQPALIYTGYMLFWAHGDWKLQARDRNGVIGELVLRL
jgi:hypothetical protein